MTLSSIPEIHFSARSCVLWIMSVMIYFIGPIFHFKYFCLIIFQCFNLFVNILFISNVFFHLINSCSSTSETVLTRPWISSLNSHICLLNSSIRSLILLQRGTLNLPQILWLYFGFCNFGLPSPCGVGSRVAVVSCIVCCFLMFCASVGEGREHTLTPFLFFQACWDILAPVTLLREISVWSELQIGGWWTWYWLLNYWVNCWSRLGYMSTGP